ncbi:ets-domain-containing protein [Ditylenchus destructor]|uniref:Ets-domain-containing protein n=1 Tax=Ditylenchus destructor TaxID=166010 RepID=A0AAD4NH29_9BILA|nr:ets-domain-containing protein [Ditylenchus destructor]
MKKYLAWKKSEVESLVCHPAIASSPPPVIHNLNSHNITQQFSPTGTFLQSPSTAASAFDPSDLLAGLLQANYRSDQEAARLYLASRTLEAAGQIETRPAETVAATNLRTLSSSSQNDQNSQSVVSTTVGGASQLNMVPGAGRQPKQLEGFLSAALAAASTQNSDSNQNSGGSTNSAQYPPLSFAQSGGGDTLASLGTVDSSGQKTNNAQVDDPTPHIVNNNNNSSAVGSTGSSSTPNAASTGSLLYQTSPSSSFSSSLSLPGPPSTTTTTTTAVTQPITGPSANSSSSQQSAQAQQSSSSSALLSAMAAAVAAANCQSAINQLGNQINQTNAAAAAASIFSVSQHRLDRSPSSLALLQNSPSCAQQLLAQAASNLLQNPVSPANNQQNPTNPNNSFLSSQTHSSAFQIVSTLPKPIGIAPSPGQSHNAGIQSSAAQLFPQYSALDTITSQQSPRTDQNTNQQSINSASSSLSSLYPGFACLPNFLDNIGQQVLRSNTSTQMPKPIPNNERVDLLRFRIKETQEWEADDVVAWMLDVARRHGIECENLNMHKFATYTGRLLMVMSEQNFKECDPCYGSLLYTEFRKLISDDTFIDDFIRSCKGGVGGGRGSNDESANTAASRLGLANAAATLSNSLSMANTILSQQQQQQVASQKSPENIAGQGGLLGHCPPHMQSQAGQQSTNTTINGLLAAAVVAAANRPHPLGLPSDMHSQIPHQHTPQQLFQQHQSATAGMSSLNMPGVSGNAQNTLLAAQQRLLQPSSLISHQMSGPTSALPERHEFDCKASTSNADPQYGASDSAALRLKVRKNKDGRPRKRSQHTKGNKLWEFIRDALKDSSTCPSVVRWEDPTEGVFRIVESEKLARLWGDKKNNQKMTYEKLSRAMRTYYEKQILVPVPKTGLYPKKLVYKFGPCAHGWSAPPHLILASSAHMMDQR